MAGAGQALHQRMRRFLKMDVRIFMKPKEIRDMTLEDMRAKDVELTKELFNLNMRHATRQLDNPLRLRFLRKDIARVKTIIAEKAGEGAKRGK